MAHNGTTSHLRLPCETRSPNPGDIHDPDPHPSSVEGSRTEEEDPTPDRGVPSDPPHPGD